MKSKIPTVSAEGIGFVSKLKARNQITVDSAIVEMMKLEKDERYHFLLVVAKDG